MNLDESAKKQRISWIDCAKGICILLVIVGHTLRDPNNLTQQMIRGFIFTFHMPLFFVASSYTTRFSESGKECIAKAKKSFIHLIGPAVFLFVFQTLIIILTYGKPINYPKYLTSRLYTLIWASGVKVILPFRELAPFGIMWFLVVLFFTKTIYDLLQMKIKKNTLYALTGGLSVVGILLGINQIYLPASFDIVLAVMPFYALGQYFKEHLEIEKASFKRILLLLGVVAVFLILFYYYPHYYLEFAPRRYPLYPLCYLSAAAGVLMIFYGSYFIKDTSLYKGLVTLGKDSMLMFEIHAMDYVFWKLWGPYGNVGLQIFIRIFIDLIVFIIIRTLLQTFRKQK